MRTHRLMPVPHCENDVGGRFTKSPHHDSQWLRDSSLVFSSAYASMPGRAPAEQALGEVDGSAPPLPEPGTGMGQGGFHNHRPALLGVAPVQKVSLQEGFRVNEEDRV